jgi:hypothetical protein
MQTPIVSTVFAAVLALSVSAPAAAAEKVVGVNKDFQRLSETSVNIPDKPGHTLKLITLVWKSVSSNPNFGEAWASCVEQQDSNGTDTALLGYGTNHYQSGDVSYFRWEGTRDATKKDAGDIVAHGTWTWLGGTGKFKTIKGSGTFSCKFGSGQCEWEIDADM